jgi:DNA polymerase
VRESLTELLSYLDDIGYNELYVPDDGGSSDDGKALGRGDRLARLTALCDQARRCTECRLSDSRRTVVVGSGNPDADLLLIGEGPGAEEDRRGLPFVGPAGELLTRIIEAIDLTRDDVYITNVVKCRPPRNRDPKRDEVQACLRFLEAQIDLVRPRVIVALGRISASTLLGTDGTMRSMRGRWHSVRGLPVRVTYHPAALLRDPSYRRPTWEDMQAVRDRLLEAP